jgi:hypothetical protein
LEHGAFRESFEPVAAIAREYPNVVTGTKYDGAPIVKAFGAFMAGLALHPSAEPGTLVVRAEIEQREGLLHDAPGTYYLTDHYRRHPVVLVRLSRVTSDVLRELLAAAWRINAGRAFRKDR